MVNENKNNVMAAVAGVVVGAGAVLAGAVALADKKNQKKVAEVIAKGQSLARNYAHDVNEKVSTTEAKAKKLVKVVKTAEKGVKNL